MSSDFGLRGPKAPWVCPNDRQLALRAKLKAGWSVKTNQFNVYPKPAPFTEKEQQAIVSVIKKAEEMDLHEQQRVGKLVDRLESLKKLASGNGITECVLCGDSFGLSVFGRTSYRCSDCKKLVCRKCAVDLTTTTGTGDTAKETIVRLCKLCAEKREFVKKSGAWFYKGVPQYILPEKKNQYSSLEVGSSKKPPTTYQEQRYMSRYINSQSSSLHSGGSSKRSGGVFWSKSIANRSQSEMDNDSSSGDEAATKPSTSSTNSAATLSNCEKGRGKSFSSFERKFNRSGSSASGSGGASITPISFDTASDDRLYEVSDPSITLGVSGLQQKSFERFDLSDSGRSHSEVSFRTPSPAVDIFPLTPIPSTSRARTPPSPQPPLPQESPLGTIDVSVLYDEIHQALYCSLHKAKELLPSDRNGLSDPYCMLKLIPTRFEGTNLRTKTVNRTLHPIFNETLTFYGVTQNDLTLQTLQINVMDEDRWGKDCLGSVQIPLHRIRPQQTRFFTLNLERARYIRNSEDREWSRGRLLLSLSYVTEKSVLLVGVVRAQDLPALDQNGTSDPFVKVRFVYNAAMGSLNSSYFSISKKYKTSVKWKTLNPEFREEFSLKVSVLDLPKLALAVSVWDKDFGKHNDYIGGILLSSESKGERLRHWTDMMTLQNSKHLKWHTLSSAELPE